MPTSEMERVVAPDAKEFVASTDIDPLRPSPGPCNYPKCVLCRCQPPSCRCVPKKTNLVNLPISERKNRAER